MSCAEPRCIADPITYCNGACHGVHSDGSPKDVMSAAHVKEWIEYYMSGGELEDDIQQQLFSMALKYAELLEQPKEQESP